MKKGPDMQKPTLNIGCGKDIWGDVRVDVDPKSAANHHMNVDAETLPWPDKSFREVRLWHVLEHSRNPQRLLNEALRVGDIVHLKFPYKYDRIPFILSLMTSPDPRKWYDALHDCFWHFMYQLGLSDTGWAHRWLIQPVGRCKLNKIAFPMTFLCGRKSKILRHLTIRMDAEWECRIP